MDQRDLTTFCGIYCGDCPRFKARFSDLAEELLGELYRVKFAELAIILGLAQYPDAASLLGVLVGMKCETPCRLGGDGCGGQPCQVKACTREKGLEGCWQCDGFEQCDKLDFLKPFCGDAPLNNLRKIRELGLEGWAGQREKQYPWQ